MNTQENKHSASLLSQHDREGLRQKYTLESRCGYYYLVNHETGREQNTGYDCGDYTRQDNGEAHPMLLEKYKRALSLTF